MGYCSTCVFIVLHVKLITVAQVTKTSVVVPLFFSDQSRVLFLFSPSVCIVC